MRVVAGTYKGRRIAGPRGGQTRPTADKVREALFSILGSVDGLRVLDLFAGTGAIGIEALSRGAASATFVERDNRMRAILRTNLNVVVGDDSQAGDLRVVGGDALRFLERAAGSELYDIVFVDPPYAQAEALAESLAEWLPDLLTENGMVVAECDRRSPLLLENALQPDSRRRLDLVTERRYGDTLLRILRAVNTAA